MNFRVAITDISDIALKEGHVNGVETDDGYVKPYVGFGYYIAEVVRSG